ncbi:hypothetical protein AB0M39_41805 [Streptomyces sp. NPDC051907]|uniref:hypothetical protein n=1 Tax=Streptomyces sp. NPDC051907 TaxID=3155284 RepID=UPI003418B5EA
MPFWHQGKIVHVDRTGDKERASDGHSRYGSYVGAREESFKDHFEDNAPLDPISFARQAWYVASPPVMSPGLVDWRPDLAKVDLERTEEGDNLAVVVTLPLTHSQLAARIPYTYGDWERYAMWSDNGYDYLQQPMVKLGQPLVTASAEIRHIPAWSLLQPTALTGPELVEEALASVEAVAAAINAELPEIIRTVLGGER